MFTTFSVTWVTHITMLSVFVRCGLMRPFTIFYFLFLENYDANCCHYFVWLICRIKRNYIMKFTILSPYGLTRDTNIKKGPNFQKSSSLPPHVRKKNTFMGMMTLMSPNFYFMVFGRGFRHLGGPNIAI